MDGLNVAQTSSSATAASAMGAASDSVKKYNKSSFFDEISCDVLDRAQGERRRRPTGAFPCRCVQRRLSSDTACRARSGTVIRFPLE